MSSPVRLVGFSDIWSLEPASVVSALSVVFTASFSSSSGFSDIWLLSSLFPSPESVSFTGLLALFISSASTDVSVDNTVDVDGINVTDGPDDVPKEVDCVVEDELTSVIDTAVCVEGTVVELVKNIDNVEDVVKPRADVEDVTVSV